MGEDGAGVADDLRAPARPRGEDAVIHEQVHRGARDEGRKQQPGGDPGNAPSSMACPTVAGVTRIRPTRAEAAVVIHTRSVIAELSLTSSSLAQFTASTPLESNSKRKARLDDHHVAGATLPHEPDLSSGVSRARPRRPWVRGAGELA